MQGPMWSGASTTAGHAWLRGLDALSDEELLEMLLVFSRINGNPSNVAADLITRYGSFPHVLGRTSDELLRIPGLDLHTVAMIKFADASAFRLIKSRLKDPIFSDLGELANYLLSILGKEPIEQLRVMFLDARNRLIADEVFGRGTVNRVCAYPREIMKRALELNATALILAHNHPSGGTHPSPEDIEMTAEIKAAAETLSIVLQDHLIVGGESWSSFRRMGLL